MNTRNYEVIEHDASEIEHVTLQTKPTLVVDNTRDSEWLAREIFSTPYASILD